jgi:predicted Zn-dependent protease with MMP-like domain
MSEAEFDRAVEEALREIPKEFEPYLENLMIEVQPRPDARLLREYDVPDDLLGLYLGVPLEDKAAGGQLPMPDRVLIFRENLLEMCESRAELLEEIRITVLHEVGHHFGLDEERLEDLGYD